MTVRGVSPKVREENERWLQQQQLAFEQQAQAVRKTLRDMGRQDLVDELDGKNNTHSRHPYYDSEQFKRDRQYFDSAPKSESFTFRDFWFWFSHAYHDPALPPPDMFRLVGAFCWVALIVEGIRWLCS